MTGQFYVPTKIVTGTGCVSAQGGLMAPLGTHALVVTGARSANACGALDHVTAALTANGQSFTVFDGALPNPTVESVYGGVALAGECGADFVVAIGGGSPMDTAKAIALVAAQGIPKEALFSGKYGDRALPLVCIPTTSGTGSEVTQYSILTNDTAKTKTSLATPLLFPRIAYLDGAYTAGLPHRVTVNTAIDAFSHCAEGMLSNLSGEISDALAKEGLRRISDCFDALAEDSLTPKQRDSLMLASTLGGMVIAVTGTTAAHAMGYSLTYFRHIEHGRANGLLLVAFLKFCEGTIPERIAELLTACGCSTPDELGAALDRLLGEKESLTDQEADHFASLAIRTGNIAKCLVRPTEADLRAMLRQSL